MTFGTFLYKLFIYPIEMVLEMVFYLGVRLFQNYGLCIVLISLVINLLVLPLYKKADALQEAERNKQKQMEPWLKHIKACFRGNERYFIQSAYYREQNYKPIYALRGTLSLAFQVPFFIAAYHFLSNLISIQGESFLFIRDLGAPDQLLAIGSVKVNFLPVLMTGINIVSSIIYTKGSPLKDKIQLYAIAFLFLFLLYDSPAGLVLYWTLNNLFSLIKNIAARVFQNSFKKQKAVPSKTEPTVRRGQTKTVWICLILLAVFLGLYVPSNVIVEEVESFISYSCSPLELLMCNFAVYTGLFLIWVNVYYHLSPEKQKARIADFICIITFSALLDFFLFGKQYGIIDQEFRFNNDPVHPLPGILINLAVLAAVCFVCLFFFRKHPRITFRTVCIVLISLVAVSSVNLISVYKDARSINRSAESEAVNEHVFPFYKKGKNVLFIMLDKAVGEYLPYAMAEMPSLQKSYSGFTFYPNTVSFGQTTLTGSGALFGGYDYSIFKMNERTEESFEKKQAEAVSVLPVLFAENGYEVTVCDPPLTDISVYSKYGGIRACRLNSNLFRDEVNKYEILTLRNRIRNVTYYSLLKTSPLIVRGFLYASGRYMDVDNIQMNTFGIEHYYRLASLIPETDILDGEGYSFMAFNNNLPHEPLMLDASDYSLTLEIDPADFTVQEKRSVSGESLTFNSNQIKNYHSYMASMRLIAEWIDYLKLKGVYDNTRIVICADHGNNAIHHRSLMSEGIRIDVEALNPLLMVKDFYSAGFTVSGEFMTNADVPYLLTRGIMEHPENPFSGNLISAAGKNAEDFRVTLCNVWEADGANVIDLGDVPSFHVEKDIYSSENWRAAGQK